MSIILTWICISITVFSCDDNNEDLISPKVEDETGNASRRCGEESFRTPEKGTSPRSGINNWKLVWRDDFNYPNRQLDRRWVSQNGYSGHILSSRWRENAVVKNGVLELLAKKENRGGARWTTGNIWTKRTFGYGYFECRFKYAGAAGTNNSFWLFPKNQSVNGSKLICELDINEGHFPNEVNTNRHHWQNGSTENNQIAFAKGLSPGYSHTFENTINTKRIRFSSKNSTHFHIREFKILKANNNCNYPRNILSNNTGGAVNLTARSNIKASGVFNSNSSARRV
ncbi:MAG: family 16 glycosylhydrolase, partial [Bacteroidota bacterium]